jgi:prolycopene isomerase
MAEIWDTIIVGAGIGGLTAAAELVKAGLRVLVLDRNPHPGGTAYVYKRKGFSFPMGPLGFSNPALVTGKLNDLGDNAEFKLDRIHYHIRAFDFDIPLSLPFPRMIEELSGLFPSDSKGIKQFFHEVEAITTPSPHPVSDPLTQKTANETAASDYLSRTIKDWKLRRILGSLGTREAYSSFPLLAAMWDLMCKEGIWYPVGSTKSLCDRLTERVTGPFRHSMGSEKVEGTKIDLKRIGKIHLAKEVTKIRTKGGSVVGVLLSDGTELNSAFVISNADYKTTFVKLMDREGIPDPLYRAVVHARQTGSIFQVCLGVDMDRVDLSAFNKAQRLIYRRNQTDSLEDLTVDWRAPFIDPDVLAQQEFEIGLWVRNDPSLVPEGGASIVIRVEADHSHFSRFRTAWRKRSPGYDEYKMRLGQSLFREAEKIMPGLEKSVVVTDIATPLTFEEQGGRSAGAVAGWSWDYEDCKDLRPRELVRTPIKGLYMAGYQAFSALFMGGIPTAMESGKRAAEAVLGNVDPTGEIPIPGMVIAH